MPKIKKGVVADMTFDHFPGFRVPGQTAPVLLPTLVECGATCICVNGSAGWLAQLLSRGKNEADCVGVVQAFCAEVHTALRVEGGGSSDQEASAGADGKSTPGKGRAALGLDDDSDEEALAGADGPNRRPAKRPRLNTPPSNEWRTVAVHGLEITAKRRARGHGLLVPLVGEKVLAMVRHLHERLNSQETASPKKRLQRKESDPSTSARGDLDMGRVKWLFATHQWQILWVDSDGKHHSCTKGLTAPRVAFDGSTLDGERYRSIREELLASARKRWNVLDQSDKPRYP